MIAGFIILRLRSILGRKTGHESKGYPSFSEKKFNIPKNNVQAAKQNLEVLEGNEQQDMNFEYRLSKNELKVLEENDNPKLDHFLNQILR